MSEPTIGWMLANEIVECLDVAKARGLDRDEDYFYQSLQDAQKTNITIEHEGKIVGYVMYVNHPYKVIVTDIATDPVRSGYGTDLLELIESRIEGTDRTRIEIHTPEENLGTQLFLKARGFRAVRTYANQSGNEFYVFVKKIIQPTE